VVEDAHADGEIRSEVGREIEEVAVEDPGSLGDAERRRSVRSTATTSFA
jgi:hypothetical protein